MTTPRSLEIPSGVRRRVRIDNLDPQKRKMTAGAFFDDFEWEPSPVDPRRLSAEDFLRML